jgi:hypothetical protein
LFLEHLEVGFLDFFEVLSAGLDYLVEHGDFCDKLDIGCLELDLGGLAAIDLKLD